MAKTKFKKIANQGNKIIKKAREEIIKNQCQCYHQDTDGYPDLDIVSKDGKRAFKCKACEKYVSTAAPSNDELKNAVDIVDTALDYLKMKLNTKSEKQSKVIDYAAEVQFKLRKLAPAYCQLKSEGDKNANKKNKNGHRGGAILHMD